MRRPLLAVCLCLILVTAIYLLFADSRSDVPERWPWEDIWQKTVPEAFDGQEIVVAGQVYQKDENYYYINSVQILEDVATLRQRKSIEANLILERPQGSNALLGSVVVVQGTFHTYLQATNPGEFDAKIYYRTLGICGNLQDVKLLGTSEDYSQLQEVLYRLREYFVQRLYRIFPEKEASVMCTILLGEKSGLDKELKELYQRNGMIHILSISGLHISVIGMSLFKLLKRTGVPVWMAAVCGGGILCLYGLMTGMGISACRAIGMYLIRMLGVCLGRTYDMMTAWGIVGVIMIVSNPYYLQHSGFLLSYASVLGIGVLFPTLKEIFESMERNVQKENMLEENRGKEILRRIWAKTRDGLKQSILAGTSVTIMTLPVQLWFYFEVPVYSVFLNLLVLPLMGLLMVAGMIAMLVPGLGGVGMVDVLILKWYESCCCFFDGLPFHNWNPGRPEVWQVVVYYGVLFGFMGGYVVWKERVEKELSLKEQSYKAQTERWRRKQQDLLKSAWKVGTFITLTVLVIAVSEHPSAGHTVTFLDVGQGDCICIQTQSGKVYLFDCGSTSRSKVGTYVLKPFLKYYGISRVDAVFLSHPDADHISGIEELLLNQKEWGIEVKNLVVSQCDEESYRDYEALLKELSLKELPEESQVFRKAASAFATQLHRISTGDAWEVDGIAFWCLHPGADFQEENSNAASQCYYVDFGAYSLLLTGDVEGVGEQQLIQSMKASGLAEPGFVDITVLKVAHHGSQYSTSEEFLRWVKPQVAVVSCGRNNVYGHPHKETLGRLQQVESTVLTTSEYGAITMEIKKEIQVHGFKE